MSKEGSSRSALDEAYSKFYCNAIDFRRPFCPFDLHGSCKDSNCLYQHSNVMIMDNYQRTEHFLSYCPQLLELNLQAGKTVDNITSTNATASMLASLKSVTTVAQRGAQKKLSKFSFHAAQNASPQYRKLYY